MPKFTSVETFKKLCRVTTDDDDDAIALCIAGASAMVANYLKAAAEPYVNAEGNVPSGVTIPAEIEVATCMLAGMIYQNPDQDPDKLFRQGNLPKPVTAILTPLRAPAVA